MVCLALYAVIASGAYTPPVWNDLPARIDYLIAQVQHPSPARTKQEDPEYAAEKELLVIGKPAIPALLKLLNSSGKQDRYIAMDLLGELKVKQAVNPLLARLKGTADSKVKIALVLGNIADRSAIPALIKCMKRDGPETIEQIELVNTTAYVLADLHATAAIPTIAAQLDYEPRSSGYSPPIAVNFVPILARFGKAIVPQVTTYLKSKHPKTRFFAALALANVGDFSGKRIIMANLDHPQVRVDPVVIADALKGWQDLDILAWARGAVSYRPLLAGYLLQGFPASIAGDDLLKLFKKSSPDARDEVFNRVEDPEYALVLLQAYDSLLAENPTAFERRSFLSSCVVSHAFPGSKGMLRKVFLEGEDVSLGLAKLDPAFLSNYIGSRLDVDQRIERCLIWTGFWMRDYLLGHRQMYSEGTFLSLLADVGDARDEEAFLRRIDDPAFRSVALSGLLKIRHLSHERPNFAADPG